MRDVLEFADEPERLKRVRDGIILFLVAQQRCKQDPQDDLISELVRATHDGEPVEDSVVLGSRGSF